MEKIIKILTKESANINQAALLLGSFTFLSQILALFRDRSYAHFIGPSPTLDFYYVAFRIPDLIFICIASLAGATVLIPFIAAKMPARQSQGGKDGKATDEARKYLNNIFTVFFAGIGVIFLYPIFGIYGLSIGVFLGAFMHVEIQALAVSGSGSTPKISGSVNFS